MVLLTVMPLGDHSSTTQHVDDDDQAALPSTSTAPPAKKIHVESVLYGCFDRRKRDVTDDSQLPISALVKKYLDYVRSAPTGDPWPVVQNTVSYKRLMPLFERVFCAPATSAPVERVFSQSGLILRPHRARLTDKMLSNLVFLKCNSHID